MFNNLNLAEHFIQVQIQVKQNGVYVQEKYFFITYLLA